LKKSVWRISGKNSNGLYRCRKPLFKSRLAT